MSSIPWPFPSIRSLIRERINARVARWARKRQGADTSITQLASRRIYILPTGVGIIFGLMTFAMLLGSMNYNNNLSFVLTFLLIGLGFISMHQCQRNLVGLEVSFAGIDPVYAGQLADFKIAITNHSGKYRHHLQLYVGNTVSEIDDLAPGESRVLHLEIPTRRRGHIELQRFGIQTLFPFEMFRAWTWLHMDLTGLVYPCPADDAPEPPPTETARGHRQHDARGEEDFAGLRKFHAGDSPRHVSWKAYARSGDLLTKQFSGADTSSQWLDFEQIDSQDVEARLSTLTRWILDAERVQRDYGLRIPKQEFPPAHGGAHRHRCLAALALFGNPAGAVDGQA